MKEIQKIVNEKVQSMVDDGSIQTVIEEGIKKAIERAISNQFESYGNITKQIEEAMKSGLQIDTKELPFETYNQQMLVAVKSRLGNLFQGVASERFMSEIDKLLTPAPKEMSLKELVERVAQSWKTDEPWEADDLDEDATVELEEHSYGYSLRMWKKRSEDIGSISRRSVSDLELFITDRNDDYKIRINHRHNYNPTCFSEHEGLVFKLYAAGTIITGIDEFDEDDCDLTLKEMDY